MKSILVGVFDSPEHARAAHTTLLDQGFRDGQLGVDAGPQAAGERGLAGLVSRMFSGFLQDGDPRERAYAVRVGRGGGIVAVHDLDDAACARARAILRQHGATDVASHEPIDDTSRGRQARDRRAPTELAAVASVGGPQAYVLPNAPTDWGRFTGGSPASIGQSADPARPEGEIEDALGLDPEADRAQVTRQERG